MPTPRLAVSLINDDGKTLEELRTALEKRLNRRFTLAEVVRHAIKQTSVLEGNNAAGSPYAYLTIADIIIGE